ACSLAVLACRPIHTAALNLIPRPANTWTIGVGSLPPANLCTGENLDTCSGRGVSCADGRAVAVVTPTFQIWRATPLAGNSRSQPVLRLASLVRIWPETE